MAVVRKSISFTESNYDFAANKSKILFDNCLSKYINFTISKQREKELKKKV